MAALAGAALLAWAAARPGTAAADRFVAAALGGLPPGVLAWLNVVWILGALPVTAAVLLLWTIGCRRRRDRPAAARLWTAWLAFAGIGFCEVASKHFIPTPQPPGGVGEPALLAWIEARVNPDPAAVGASLARWIVALSGHSVTPAAARASVALRGSFPSGHVARLTFAAALVLPRRTALAAGALAALAVSATAGHWAVDAVGGWLLAIAALAALDASARRREGAGGPGRRRRRT